MYGTVRSLIEATVLHPEFRVAGKPLVRVMRVERTMAATANANADADANTNAKANERGGAARSPARCQSAI